MATIHIVTPEFPPQCGGVAEYTHQVAGGLAAAGDQVHVWTPATAERQPTEAFTVHPELGSFRNGDLRRAGELLDRFEGPRRLIVQWVPHGYGFRAMNLGFCLWLRKRAMRGDVVELMVHEPYLSFWEGSLRQTAAAVVHRAMTIVLLRAARRVWVAIPAWEPAWRPYALGRDIPFDWLPIPSALPTPDADEVAALRGRLSANDHYLIGHLGTYGAPVTSLLREVLVRALAHNDRIRVLLIGSGSERFRDELLARRSEWQSRVFATGRLPTGTLSAHVAACDLLVQPYPDGVSSRRTTVMAGLRLGVPVVTTAGRLTEPFWKTSGAIRLSPVGDPAGSLADIDHLLAHPEERTRLAERGRAFYDSTFDIRRTVYELRAAA